MKLVDSGTSFERFISRGGYYRFPPGTLLFGRIFRYLVGNWDYSGYEPSYPTEYTVEQIANLTRWELYEY
jgi:hypothetical protein